MMKQTVYLNNFARKSGFRLQFLRQLPFKLTDDFSKQEDHDRPILLTSVLNSTG